MTLQGVGVARVVVRAHGHLVLGGLRGVGFGGRIGVGVGARVHFEGSAHPVGADEAASVVQMQNPCEWLAQIREHATGDALSLQARPPDLSHWSGNCRDAVARDLYQPWH